MSGMTGGQREIILKDNNGISMRVELKSRVHKVKGPMGAKYGWGVISAYY